MWNVWSNTVNTENCESLKRRVKPLNLWFNLVPKEFPLVTLNCVIHHASHRHLSWTRSTASEFSLNRLKPSIKYSAGHCSLLVIHGSWNPSGRNRSWIKTVGTDVFLLDVFFLCYFYFLNCRVIHRNWRNECLQYRISKFELLWLLLLCSKYFHFEQLVTFIVIQSHLYWHLTPINYYPCHRALFCGKAIIISVIQT